LRTIEHTRSARYYAALVDLNDDSVSEALVYMVSRDTCGSGGCSTLILARISGGWKIVTEISLTRPPIECINEKLNGWHSLSVWVQGGGIQPGYNAELRFDGTSYPANPTVPPARRLSGHPASRILIPESIRGVALYPSEEALERSRNAASGAEEERGRPSFDCNRATTRVEKLICNDPGLAVMDLAMASAYEASQRNRSEQEKSSIRAAQRAWLRRYSETCNAISTDAAMTKCISRFLSARTEVLRSQAQ
jgi:uncharacterized protein YecT (DUF1311 family)